MVKSPYSRSRPSWASADDYAGFNFIVILVGACIFGYLAWINFHTQISAFVMSVMHYEIGLIDHFSNRYRLADQQMTRADPSDVTFNDLYGIAQAVGMYFRVPAAGLIAILAIICAIRAAPSRFKRRFDLDGLIKEHARSFPVISAFAYRHLILAPPNAEASYPADYALTPVEWIARFASDNLGRFNEQQARAALAAQLGDRWTGPENAAPAARLLFTVFALHLSERREDALQLLGEASASLVAAKQDGTNGPQQPLHLPDILVERVDKFLVRNMDSAKKTEAKSVADRHAYVTSALMSLLSAARIKAGVMAPAQFVWLKLVDRNLWYALHSLGYEIEGIGRYIHPNPRVEALGARDHWAAERAAGRPILRPNFAEAIAVLRQADDVSKIDRGA